MAQTQKNQTKQKEAKPRRSQASKATAPCGEQPVTVLGEEDAPRIAALLTDPPALAPGLVDAAARYRNAFPGR